MSSLGRRHRLRCRSLPAVNRPRKPQDIWLVRPVVTRAAGCSSPEASVVLEDEEHRTTILGGHETNGIEPESAIGYYYYPFQACWSVNVIHKLPDSTPDHIHCQYQTAYQLVLHSRHTPGLNIC